MRWVFPTFLIGKIKMAMLKARTEFALALNQICSEHNIEPAAALDSMKEALLAAYKRDANMDEDLVYEVELDEKTGESKIFSYPEKKKKERKEITPPDFGRIAAQIAKQVLVQKIREAERSAILKEYIERIGTLASGMILRFEGPNIVVDIGRAETLMPLNEQVRSENYELSNKYTFYIKEIIDTSKGEQIIVSRVDPGLVRGFFKREVPEIASGAVEIKKISREPGGRTKIAVVSRQAGVDPVGSCVGQKGIRVQAVIDELSGEKIDIIQYSDDPIRFISSALAPAEGIQVEIDEVERLATVSLPDDQLSLAIGKDGQNVRLAARLTEYKIDIQQAEKKVEKKEKDKKPVKKKKVKETKSKPEKKKIKRESKNKEAKQAKKK